VVRSRLEATEQLESHPEAVLIRGVVQQHDLHVLGLVEAAHCQRLEEDGDVLSRVHQRHLLALRREEASAAVATLEERSLNAHELAGRERVHLSDCSSARGQEVHTRTSEVRFAKFAQPNLVTFNGEEVAMASSLLRRERWRPRSI